MRRLGKVSMNADPGIFIQMAEKIIFASSPESKISCYFSLDEFDKGKTSKIFSEFKDKKLDRLNSKVNIQARLSIKKNTAKIDEIYVLIDKFLSDNTSHFSGNIVGPSGKLGRILTFSKSKASGNVSLILERKLSHDRALSLFEKCLSDLKLEYKIVKKGTDCDVRSSSGGAFGFVTTQKKFFRNVLMFQNPSEKVLGVLLKYTPHRTFHLDGELQRKNVHFVLERLKREGLETQISSFCVQLSVSKKQVLVFDFVKLKSLSLLDKKLAKEMRLHALSVIEKKILSRDFIIKSLGKNGIAQCIFYFVYESESERKKIMQSFIGKSSIPYRFKSVEIGE